MRGACLERAANSAPQRCLHRLLDRQFSEARALSRVSEARGPVARTPPNKLLKLSAAGVSCANDRGRHESW